eukprot:SAG11_NODE_8293_length_1033_cov_1.943255_1_plen_286_part_10
MAGLLCLSSAFIVSVVAHTGGQHVIFQATGADGIRITAAPASAGAPPAHYPSALSRGSDAGATSTGGEGLTNGNLRASLRDGLLLFERVSDGTELLREKSRRTFAPTENAGFFSVNLTLDSPPSEALYGLGQHQTGALDNKGQSFALRPANTEILIPVVHSSRGYTFVWNVPSFGRVALGNQTAVWRADSAPHLDIFVCTTAANLSAAQSPWADRMAKFTAAVGRAPVFPRWVSGYWQSKNRYRNQSELLAAVRGHRALGLPLAMIVIDYHTWDDPPGALLPRHTY